MKVIGITGGVGAGKSTILQYLQKHYNAKVLIADRIAHKVMEPNMPCYVYIKETFPDEIFMEDGTINRGKLGEIIFRDSIYRTLLNDTIHPAVKNDIRETIEIERNKQQVDYIIIEAALLIEDHYDKICDEIWYVYASEETRKRRLLESRNYSLEKVADIFKAQMLEAEFRKHCAVVIDNDQNEEFAFAQIEQVLKCEGERNMEIEESTFVFGLDIGTRSIVGTVGYKEGERFKVLAQYVKEHETRAMLDGQIHDIARVAKTIAEVREQLEQQLQRSLKEVCIAAAGRVLKTVTTTVEQAFSEETKITGEHVHTLDLLGIEKAQQELVDANDTSLKFYCVGYTVVKYYLNGENFSNLEGHKADAIAEDVIVTFLPEDVVDGLYTAVNQAGLEVASLTLEPIAAINVAIPENFRMLNIGLVDVGAGTSDISITKGGSIVAYGMIPLAGDEITELLIQHYLVDFKTAEQIKIAAGNEGIIEYIDIMCLKHQIQSNEVQELIQPIVERITKEIAQKIKELNGEKSVSATFIVGGGGKVYGFVERLAKELDLPKERVALRGEEVLQLVDFEQKEIKKDPLLVTPVGICLNYYDQKNNFIFVHFNEKRMKLYDNSKLTVVDAALQAGFPNEALFPRRGKELNFTMNGKAKIIRGELGEPAKIELDGREANISSPIHSNCYITIVPSTLGKDAVYTMEQLPEYKQNISFKINGVDVKCPRFAEVNGQLQSPYYSIKEQDTILLRNHYTVAQIVEFMDIALDEYQEILVNNKVDTKEAIVYENFTVDFALLEDKRSTKAESTQIKSTPLPLEGKSEDRTVLVNGQTICLKGKKEYIFVDIFDYIPFDISLESSRGKVLVTKCNQQEAQYTQILEENDIVEIYWVG